MIEQIGSLDQARTTLIDLSIKFGPKLFVALVTLSVGVFAARWTSGMAGKLLAKLQIEEPMLGLLGRIVWVAVMALFAILSLQNLGVELLPLIAGLGIAGAGVALAMQGVLGNVAAGLTIIFTRPFRVGEYVSINGVEGQVEKIGLFSTILGHLDLSHVVVPNRRIVGEIMHNYGAMRQLHVTVGVAYDADLKQAFAAIDEILASNPRVLKEPVPLVQVALLGDSSVNIDVRPWVAVPDYREALGEINAAVLETFRGRGIVIPFPQREVRLLGAIEGQAR
jgi:small conductance mechanosensitive channel